MRYDISEIRRNLYGGRRLPADKIAAWIRRNFDFKVRKNGEEYCICNPFDGDTGFNFNISPVKGCCHDWRGDEWAGPANPNTGNRNCSFLHFVKLYRNCSYQEAVYDVLGSTRDAEDYLKSLRDPPDNSKSLREAIITLPDGAAPLVDERHDRQARLLIRWLCSRGYSIEDIGEYDLHFLGTDVYWPYYEFGVLVYWQSRNRLNKIYRFPSTTVFDDEGNAIARTRVSKGDFLYGFDDVDAASYLIITESIFDQYTLGEQALASGGAVLTPNQINKLRILGPRNGIILAPNNDVAGVKSIITNHRLLSTNGFRVFYSLPPRLMCSKDGKTKFTKDWNELITEFKMSRREIRAIHDKNIELATPITISRLLSQMPRDKTRWTS